MEKKSWLWKRKSSDRSPGETESSTSISSHSESNSNEKESLSKSLNQSQSPEVTSKVSSPNTNTEVNNESFKSLTEKLSAALVNVGAKEDLVKQHAKVAEEAVAGWEKAENEVTTLKQQLEAAVQQNLALEVRANHLDGALKECVKQLRQSKENQEQQINEIIKEKTHEWELTKKDLESKISNLESKSRYPLPVDSKILLKIENLEKENSTIKCELVNQSEEVEILKIERDLSTKAAETASKQQLESIKKVAKLENECRKLQLLGRKSPSVNDNHKAVSISSFYVDSLTDSQSDSAEKSNGLDIDSQGCSDSWALALIAELDQFKNGKCMTKNAKSCSVEINNIMDDFLEMERIASLSEGQNEISRCNSENEDNSLKTELEVMRCRVYELEEKLDKLEAEKCELEDALNKSQESLALSNGQLAETKSQMVSLQKELTMVNESKEMLESRLVNMETEARIMSTEVDDLQKELTMVNESKELLESRLVNMETEARSMSTEVDLMKADVEKERRLSSEMTIKCQKLEKEIVEKTEEVKLQQAANSNGELKVIQVLEVAAADRLSECQKTISSLARQLESLATLEDFLIDTANLPGFSGGSSVTKSGGELWKLHSNDTFMPKKTLIPTKQPESNCKSSMIGDDNESPKSSSSTSSSKSKNSFEKLFSRSKNAIQSQNHQV